LIIRPGDINIDFADIKVVMQSSGTALLGIGYGEGEDRAIDAARRAIDNPLLEASLDGAKNIIFAVTGGDDLTPIEVQEAARVVEEIADPEAMIVWGMTFDESYHGEVKVTIIATGFPSNTQEEMLKDVGRKTGALSRLGSTRTATGQSFVGRAMNDEGVPSQMSVAQEEEVAAPSRDFETPAFLRKKLLTS